MISIRILHTCLPPKPHMPSFVPRAAGRETCISGTLFVPRAPQGAFPLSSSRWPQPDHVCLGARHDVPLWRGHRHTGIAEARGREAAQRGEEKGSAWRRGRQECIGSDEESMWWGSKMGGGQCTERGAMGGRDRRQIAVAATDAEKRERGSCVVTGGVLDEDEERSASA